MLTNILQSSGFITAYSTYNVRRGIKKSFFRMSAATNNPDLFQLLE